MLRRVCDGLICVLVVMTLVGGPLQAQGNDEPQLCVGDYQSADEAKAQLARFVQTFSNLAEWQQRARTNREAILRGTDIGQKTVRLAPAAVFYLAYVAGLVYLVSLPAIRSGAPILIPAFLIGLMAYGTYEFTSYSIMKDWHWTMVV
ncbi:MAG TPA: DUF2177 family protein, partial [Sedimentisphaerales bacterium]|nr:DUF2177 family protein [Sedimentisphaerales bacterium]